MFCDINTLSLSTTLPHKTTLQVDEMTKDQACSIYDAIQYGTEFFYYVITKLQRCISYSELSVEISNDVSSENKMTILA